MQELTIQYLNDLKPGYIKSGYEVPKWIQFSENMIRLGCVVELIRSKSTVSKYLYISRGNKNFKVRFSNHKPNKYMEREEDCDYYVGVRNKGCMTTEQVIEDLKTKFGIIRSNHQIAEEVIHNRRTIK
jgi:hypothetical protein